MAQEHVSVLIVGAGGAGLSLSLLLQQQGIPSVLIERRSDVSWYPRARNLNFRTLEVFRGLGLEAEVLAAGSRITRMFRKQSLASSEQEEILDPTSLVEHLEGISPEPFGWYCPQSHLEPLLLAEAKRRGSDVRYGTELVSFMQDETGVTATMKNHADRSATSAPITWSRLTAHIAGFARRSAYPRKGWENCQSTTSLCTFEQTGAS